MSEPTTNDFTRKEIAVAAGQLATALRRFIGDADQFLSTFARYDLNHAASQLEDLAE